MVVKFGDDPLRSLHNIHCDAGKWCLKLGLTFFPVGILNATLRIESLKTPHTSCETLTCF